LPFFLHKEGLARACLTAAHPAAPLYMGVPPPVPHPAQPRPALRDCITLQARAPGQTRLQAQTWLAQGPRRLRQSGGAALARPYSRLRNSLIHSDTKPKPSALKKTGFILLNENFTSIKDV